MLFHELRDDAVQGFLRVHRIAGLGVGGVEHLSDHGKRADMSVGATYPGRAIWVHGALEASEESVEDTGEVIDWEVVTMYLGVFRVARMEAVGGVEGRRETPLAQRAFLERGALVGPGRVMSFASSAGVCKSAEQGAEDGAEWVNGWADSARTDGDARDTTAVGGGILNAVDVTFVGARRFGFPAVVGM